MYARYWSPNFATNARSSAGITSNCKRIATTVATSKTNQLDCIGQARRTKLCLPCRADAAPTDKQVGVISEDASLNTNIFPSFSHSFFATTSLPSRRAHGKSRRRPRPPGANVSHYFALASIGPLSADVIRPSISSSHQHAAGVVSAQSPILIKFSSGSHLGTFQES